MQRIAPRTREKAGLVLVGVVAVSAAIGAFDWCAARLRHAEYNKPYPSVNDEAALRTIYERAFSMIADDDRRAFTHFFETETSPGWHDTSDGPVDRQTQLTVLQNPHAAEGVTYDSSGKAKTELTIIPEDVSNEEQVFPMGFHDAAAMSTRESTIIFGVKIPVRWSASYTLDTITTKGDTATVTFRYVSKGSELGQQETITQPYRDTWMKSPHGWRWSLEEELPGSVYPPSKAVPL